MTEIVLIGLQHYDREGRARLQRALKREKPDLITVETGPKALDLYRVKGRGKKKKSEFDEVMDLLKKKAKERYSRDDIAEAERFFKYVVGYEFKGALEYAGRNRISCEAIDFPNEHDRQAVEVFPKLSTVTDLVEYYNMLLGSDEDVDTQEELEGHYARYAEMLAQNNLDAQSGEVDYVRNAAFGNNPRRDHFPADRLRGLAGRDIGKIVSLVGMVHILDDPKGQTLYSIIKEELQPTRKLLNSY
ncbi:hypothetical protein COV16_07490 [Candidatus Woesearchaeota archaeon CG10_big_fil_rev_8_21_14_0_10_34_8]|nr:MAG: hypothetical protein COV16_07490 [Candidatus Woesearchaeota archaeon CG10_big_fil_rev_8_21_14_0_10_34_8]